MARRRIANWIGGSPQVAVPVLVGGGLAALLTIALIAALVINGRRAVAPYVMGHPERCLTCHAQVSGLEPSHPVQSFGCSTCHLGNAASGDAKTAHAGMVRVPGNLDTVDRTCGRAGCHDAIATRVRGSLMATMRGVIAVDRYVFGEQPRPDGTTSVAGLASSPADSHLRQLCVSCHLGTSKDTPAPTGELSRGGGCTACHLAPSKPGPSVRERPDRFAHSGVSMRVSDDHCFGCHSRSGRISLAYAGWAEAEEAAARTEPASDIRHLADGRIARHVGEDVHHARGMACIDCHTAQETMGDGQAHLHEEEATAVRCTTCHRVTPPRTIAREALDADTATIVRIREGNAAPKEFLVEERTGIAVSNARPIDDGKVEVRGKIDSKKRIATRPAAACTSIAGHARLSCQSCHSAWVPRCIGCHTQFDPASGSDGKKGGSWVEYEVPPQVGGATLGVLARGGRDQIEPFVPGMVLTLNLPRTDGRGPPPPTAKQLVDEKTRFVRAYAYAAPHTTTKPGRSCRSCHLDPVALGYGAGRLTVESRGDRSAWRFEPAYEASRFDGLPGDAWIDFARDGKAGISTRTTARPLSREEQRRTLEVGGCMTCHDPATPENALLSEHYAESRARMTTRCRLVSLD